MRIAEKRLIRLKIPFARWAEEVSKAPNFQVQPYTLDILLEAAGLPSIRDPADRNIVATARHLGHSLITADEFIQEGDWVETVWE
jgi:PIN domain nuclease of toxin-antitoxin system